MRSSRQKRLSTEETRKDKYIIFDDFIVKIDYTTIIFTHKIQDRTYIEGLLFSTLNTLLLE